MKNLLLSYQIHEQIGKREGVQDTLPDRGQREGYTEKERAALILPLGLVRLVQLRIEYDKKAL